VRGLQQFIRGFKKGFTGFSLNINSVISSILLSVVYILGVGLTSMLARLVGKHFLDVELSKKGETYWSDLNLEKKHIERYYRQF
jgi:hypothetical protein